MNYSFSIYSALEKEVISLFNIIHISDVHLNVYSQKISDLILRCCVEIESLSKKIYNDNGFNTNNKLPEKLKFDYDCLKRLDGEWGLCSKKITISNPFIYLSDNARDIIPFEYCWLSKKGETKDKFCKWKSAYIALKHDRFNNKEQGNLINLFYSLGALFLLVVFDMKNLSSSHFSLSFSETKKFRLSEIFLLPSFYLLPINMSDSISDESCFRGDPQHIALNKKELKQSVAVIKYTEPFYKSFCNEYFHKSGFEFTVKALNDPRVIKYISKQINNGKLPGSKIYELIINAVGQDEFIKMLINTIPTAMFNKNEGEYEIIANMNQEFYPKILRPKELI